MPGFFLSVFRLVRFLMSGDAAIAIENAALRLQLAAFQRRRKRPVLTSFDRLLWVGLSLVWNGWRAALVYVQPDTVVRWQRERFRKFWARPVEKLAVIEQELVREVVLAQSAKARLLRGAQARAIMADTRDSPTVKASRTCTSLSGEMARLMRPVRSNS